MSDEILPNVPPGLTQSTSFSLGRDDRDDWKLPIRSTVLADIFQTAYLRNHGIHEQNPNIRKLGTGEAALFQALDGEALAYTIGQTVPKKYRSLAAILATLIRAAPVISNNRQGFSPSPMTIPLISTRF